MRPIRPLAVTTGFLLLVTSSLAAQAGDPVAAVRALFAAAKVQDVPALEALLEPSVRFTLLRPAPTGGSQVVLVTRDQYLQFVASPGAAGTEERIRNPQVLTDGDLATVWAEYQLVTGGKVAHCGYDAFQLTRASGTWKVLNVSDTYRQSGCGAPW